MTAFAQMSLYGSSLRALPVPASTSLPGRWRSVLPRDLVWPFHQPLVNVCVFVKLVICAKVPDSHQTVFNCPQSLVGPEVVCLEKSNIMVFVFTDPSTQSSSLVSFVWSI
jgi:hypothetical protein